MGSVRSRLWAAALATALSVLTVAGPAHADTKHADREPAVRKQAVPAAKVRPYSPVADAVELGLQAGWSVIDRHLTLGKADPNAVAAPTTPQGLPVPAIRAYRRAAKVLGSRQPSCQLRWSLLAGIGLVETDHGRYGGAILTAAGTSSPRILGPVLDGAGDFAAIGDSDNGRLDGDKKWDRAVGPMQFIPQTWASVGADGDGDGILDPFDIDDAAVAAGDYLCASGRSLLDPWSREQAILSYNHSAEYAIIVGSYADSYARGERASLSPEAVAQLEALRAAEQPKQPKQPKKPRKPKVQGHDPRQHEPRQAQPQPQPQPQPQKPQPQPQKPQPQKPQPQKPQPTPKPAPDPTPRPKPADPKPVVTSRTVTLQGGLVSCSGGWCVGGTSAGALGNLAASDDYDGDCKSESMAGELSGAAAAGATVRAVVRQKLVDGHVTQTTPSSFAMVTMLECDPPDDDPTEPTPDP